MLVYTAEFLFAPAFVKWRYTGTLKLSLSKMIARFSFLILLIHRHHQAPWPLYDPNFQRLMNLLHYLYHILKHWVCSHSLLSTKLLATSACITSLKTFLSTSILSILCFNVPLTDLYNSSGSSLHYKLYLFQTFSFPLWGHLNIRF